MNWWWKNSCNFPLTSGSYHEVDVNFYKAEYLVLSCGVFEFFFYFFRPCVHIDIRKISFRVHRHRTSRKKKDKRGILFHKLFNLFYKHSRALAKFTFCHFSYDAFSSRYFIFLFTQNQLSLFGKLIRVNIN